MTRYPHLTPSCFSRRSNVRATLLTCCCAGLVIGAWGGESRAALAQDSSDVAKTDAVQAKPELNRDLETPREDGAILRCHTKTPTIRPGDVVHVDVFLDSALTDLRGYQLHIGISGGNSGSLELIDIAIHRRSALTRPDEEPVFWSAFNLGTKQMLAGMDTPGITTEPRAYLATFSFKASDDAEGRFMIEVLHDLTDSKQRTFLFPTPSGGKITVASAPPTLITVSDKTSEKTSANRE